MALPSNLSFGTVVGRFMRAVADGPDAGTDPDGLPLVGLTVKFTPSVARFKNVTDTSPVTVFADPITVTTNDEGVLVDGQGAVGVRLLATDDTDLQPSGWTWAVSVSSTTIPTFTFNFALPSGGTIDLTSVLPVAASPGSTLPGVSSVAGMNGDVLAPALASALEPYLTGGGGGAAVWGGITGTLTDQTDLASALAGKQPAGAYATAGQGALADSAVQPADLATVATSGAYADLTGRPDLSTKLDTSAAPELIRDTIGTTLVAGSNVTIAPNDVGDTITIAAAGGGSVFTPTGFRIPLIRGSGTSSLQAGWINSVMIYLPVPVTVTELSINVTTAGAAPSNVHLGLYSITTPGGTGTLVHNFGSVDTSTTGLKTLTGTWAIPAGTYYLSELMVGSSCSATAGGNADGLARMIILPGEYESGKRYLSHNGSTSLPAQITSVASNGASGVANVALVVVTLA